MLAACQKKVNHLLSKINYLQEAIAFICSKVCFVLAHARVASALWWTISKPYILLSFFQHQMVCNHLTLNTLMLSIQLFSHLSNFFATWVALKSYMIVSYWHQKLSASRNTDVKIIGIEKLLHRKTLASKNISIEKHWHQETLASRNTGLTHVSWQQICR